MLDLVDYLSSIIRLSGGEVVGKTRLQKMAYLLEAKGVGFGNINLTIIVMAHSVRSWPSLRMTRNRWVT